MTDPEVSLAVSYYRLYKEAERWVVPSDPFARAACDATARRRRRWSGSSDGSRSSRSTDADATSAPAAASHTDGGAVVVVTVRDWTAQDAAAAERLLQASLEKCRIAAPMQGAAAESDVVAWDRFYRSHRTNFFKDRHYLEVDFPEEFTCGGPGSSPGTVRCCVEIGCGVGNAVLPLLDAATSRGGIDWTVHCLDLSAVAVNLLVQDPRFARAAAAGRAFGHCCDISQVHPAVPPPACLGAGTVATLFFCLSAIHPDRHAAAAHNACRTLAPGGVLVLRDYGRHDQGQLRLGQQRDKLVRDNFYRKHDGTKCYYFTLDDLRELFVEQCGMEPLELRYLCKVFENRADRTQRRRVWVSARFRKVVADVDDTVT